MIEICFLEPTRITEKPAPSAACEPAIDSSTKKSKNIGHTRYWLDEAHDLVSYCNDEILRRRRSNACARLNQCRESLKG
jgi:hypothetical protein